MWIAVACVGGVCLVRVLFWPVLRGWWNQIPDEHVLWPAGADEPLDDAIIRHELDAIIAEGRDRSMRQHPSWSDET